MKIFGKVSGTWNKSQNPHEDRENAAYYIIYLDIFQLLIKNWLISERGFIHKNSPIIMLKKNVISWPEP